METLYQYLDRMLHEYETTPSALAKAKREYRKQYQRAYQKEYRNKNNHVRKDIYFTPQEFSRLTKVAKQHNVSVPRLCKELSFAYINSQFVLPDDKQIRRLELYLRGVTNNLNQLVRYVHQRKDLSVIDISTLREQVNEMENHISTTLRSPVNLQDYLERLVQQKPEVLSVLHYIIETYKPK